jgi:hypothetical protein
MEKYMFSSKCKAHLHSVDMTAWQHFKYAFNIIIELKKAEIALLIHMFAPRCCETYASDKIKELARSLEEHDELHLNMLEKDNG